MDSCWEDCLANKRSALKAHRAAERRYARNRPLRSALRTFVKKARTEIELPTAEGSAALAVQLAAKRLDQAASKGVIHKNQAARRKSRLMHQLNKLQHQPVGAATVEAAPVTRARRTTRTAASGTTARTSTRRATK